MQKLIESFLRYRSAYEHDWKSGIAMYNLLQSQSTGDKVSDFYLGVSRMMIDQSVSLMTEGLPLFLPEPMTAADYKKVLLYDQLMKHNVNLNNFNALNREFIINNHVMGTACMTVGTQSPMKRRRILKPDGNTIERIVRDFDKPNVYIRNLSPFNCFRDETTDNIANIGRGGYFEHITWGEFERRFMNSPKFNTDEIDKRSQVKMTHFFDEYEDEYQLAAISHGTDDDGQNHNIDSAQIGSVIFESPITLYREGTFNSGVNILGKVPLFFSRFIPQLDNVSATHSLYGMGIPKMIDGPESIMHALLNLEIDNLVLQNTVPISYEPYDGSTAADLEGVPMYSGQFIDGKITPQPLGVASTRNNEGMQKMLQSHVIWLTGINNQQVGGSTATTAFQFGVETQQNQDRAKKRLAMIQDECYKPFGKMLLANSLASVTVEDWEELSDQEIKDVAKKVKQKQMFAEDVKFDKESGLPTKRRVMQYIKIPGQNISENFQHSKRTRSSLQMKPLGDKDENYVSYIPAHNAYMFDNDDIMSILRWDVKVETKEMVSLAKLRDIEAIERVMVKGFELVQGGLIKKPDFQKLYENMVYIVGIDPESVFPDVQKSSDLQDKAKEMYDQLNDQISQKPAMSAPDQGLNPTSVAAPTSPSPTQSPGASTTALEGLASGTV